VPKYGPAFFGWVWSLKEDLTVNQNQLSLVKITCKYPLCEQRNRNSDMVPKNLVTRSHQEIINGKTKNIIDEKKLFFVYKNYPNEHKYLVDTTTA
jgi:hypothetical protein